MTMRISKGEKIFYIINTVFLILLTLIILYPLVYVVSASLSATTAVKAGKVVLFPKGFNLEAYKYLLGDKQIWISYLNSFYYTFVGTVVSIIITVLGAYPLSKENLPGKRIITFMVVLTMWFGAGTIPTYLNFRDLGLLNTRASVIFGFAVTAFNFILLRNFFAAIPRSLEEAAEIDGASQLKILIQIYIPLSISAIATVMLFYAVSKWNAYFWSMILLQKDNLLPMQVLIKKMIVDLNVPEIKGASVDEGLADVSEETVIFASIIVSSLPMLILYPFIQKFFVKGIMVGAVKG